jgi:hypothetical protein
MYDRSCTLMIVCRDDRDLFEDDHVEEWVRFHILVPPGVRGNRVFACALHRSIVQSLPSRFRPRVDNWI